MTDEDGAGPESALTVRFWGVRGSIPTTDAATRGVGGNTACVEIVTGSGRRIIFDAGTGIRALGRELLRCETPLQADLFLTHFHWDHVQGLPFFGPLLRPSTHLRIHAPPQDARGTVELLGSMLAPVWFPIGLAEIGARIEFLDVGSGIVRADGCTVRALRAAHAGHTVGYRLESDGVTVAYLPDHELAGDPAHPSWRAALELAAGADVLIHDAMFAESEYPARQGWGHSTIERAVELALAARVRRLYLFHHAPERTDDELARLVAEARARLDAEALLLEAALEGVAIELTRR